MDKREWLIKYLENKNDIIRVCSSSEGTPDLTDQEDMDEIKSWSNANVLLAYREVRLALRYLSRGGYVTDSSLCPWCVISQAEECADCGYGERHGICWRSGSHFKSIIYALRFGITMADLLIPFAENLRRIE